MVMSACEKVLQWSGVLVTSYKGRMKMQWRRRQISSFVGI
jgi:hypothetical protein